MKRIAFVGGGTAGHVMPNLALIAALGTKYDCVYIGGDGMEKDLCAERGIPFFRIDTVKLRRKEILKNLSIPIKLIKCVHGAKSVLREIKPDLIFSKGGYAALPVVLAAGSIPVLAHESDHSPGIVTKLSRGKSKKILCAFEDTAQKINGVHVGAPLNQKLYGARPLPLGFEQSNKPVLLVMGGSLGAATLNSAVISALPKLTALFNVVHVTGKNKQSAPPACGYKSMEFCSNMPELYAAVDVAVTRGGAGSLAELAALGIPAVCVPLEKASRGDQIENAEYYSAHGTVRVLRENDLNDGTLISAVTDIYNRRQSYKAAMRRMQIDGTEKICEIIKDTIK